MKDLQVLTRLVFLPFVPRFRMLREMWQSLTMVPLSWNKCRFCTLQPKWWVVSSPLCVDLRSITQDSDRAGNFVHCSRNIYFHCGMCLRVTRGYLWPSVPYAQSLWTCFEIWENVAQTFTCYLRRENSCPKPWGQKGMKEGNELRCGQMVWGYSSCSFEVFNVHGFGCGWRWKWASCDPPPGKEKVNVLGVFSSELGEKSFPSGSDLLYHSCILAKERSGCGWTAL